MIDLHKRVTGLDLHAFGYAVALGFNEPDKLDTLLPEDPPTQLELDLDALPNMLRPTTKAT